MHFQLTINGMVAEDMIVREWPHRPLPPAVVRFSPRGAVALGTMPRAKKPRPYCINLGLIVEHCHTCGAEERHVRQCHHPDNPTETCTLGHPRSAVWRCSDCSHYEGGS